MSHTGVPLTRPTTFRFTLDPNREQEQRLLAHAGAARLAYNHHLGRVRANLDQRAAERSYGVPEADLTPSLSWSKVSFINEMNAWKDGRAADARVSVDEDGNEVRGLPWRHEVSTDVFECASRERGAGVEELGRLPHRPRGPGRPPGSRGSSPGTRRRPRSGSGRSPSPARPHLCGPTGARSDPVPEARASCGSMSTPASSRRCWPVGGSTSTPPASGSSVAAGSWSSPASPPSSTTSDAHRRTGTPAGWEWISG